jgi:hypothetical protein
MTSLYRPNFGAFPYEELMEADKDSHRFDIVMNWLGSPIGFNYENALDVVETEMRLRRIDRYIENRDVWDEAVQAITAAAFRGAGIEIVR